ncbi:hypothetical protein ACFL5H_02015 [Candidatus Latescibacterota bacterium]
MASEKYTGDFLMLGAGTKALGLGSAAVATTNDATATYYNPAGLAYLSSSEITFMHSEQFAGLINYNTFSFGMPLSENLFMGITLLHSGIGDIKYTRLIDPSQPMDDENRPVIASREDATDYTLYFSAARSFSDKLSIGGSVKVIRRAIGPDTAFGYGIDLGVRYAGLEHWQTGLILKDATGTSVAWDGKADDRIAPTLDAGIANTGTVPLIGGGYILATSMTFFGDTPKTKGFMTMNIGGEYTIGDYLSFRAGSQQGTGTFGLGIMRLPLISSSSFDYTFLADDGLDSTHRISMTVRF